MFCRNCGNQVDDNVKFCPKCGAKIITPPGAGTGAGTGSKTGAGTGSQPSTGAKSGAAAQPSPRAKSGAAPAKRRRNRVWIPIVIIVAVVVAALLLVLYFTGVTTKKVKLNDYLSVEINGYDGYGTASISFDRFQLEEDYDQKIQLTDAAIIWGYYDFSDLVDDIASAYVVPGSGLSNGDEVQVEWYVDLDDLDELVKGKVELSYEPETYEVSGLKEVQNFDAFAGISVQFSGISPDATADLSLNRSAAAIPDEAWDYLDISLSQTEGLAVGDTVTVTISEESANELMRDLGLHPGEMSKEYVVEGIPYYVTSLDQIPEEGMEKMKQQADDVFRAQISSWTLGTLISLDYLGCYFLTPKSADSATQNIEYVIYRYQANQSGDIVTGYWYCEFYNGMVLEDGTFSLDYTDYTIPTYTSSFWGDPTGTYFTHTDATNTKAYYVGYPDLDTMFNQLVTQYIDKYYYESTVQEP